MVQSWLTIDSIHLRTLTKHQKGFKEVSGLHDEVLGVSAVPEDIQGSLRESLRGFQKSVSGF